MSIIEGVVLPLTVLIMVPLVAAVTAGVVLQLILDTLAVLLCSPEDLEKLKDGSIEIQDTSGYVPGPAYQGWSQINAPDIDGQSRHPGN